MISYRTFRNSDPPRIVELWNTSAPGRGWGQIANCDYLEQLIFAKTYFDPAGLVLAFDDQWLVGFAHAGFGSDETQSQLDPAHGVIAAILVRPEARRKHIGAELLRRSENYLIDHGARTLFAGGVHPCNPFYLGLYGGSESPGILSSDAAALDFLKSQGYKVVEKVRCFQRRLQRAPTVEDTRLPLLRREIEILAEPWPMPDNWWQGCTMGPLATLRYEMVERTTRQLVGSAWAWKMDSFERKTGVATFGITNFRILPERRQHGFGTLLLHSMMRHLFEEGVGLIEVQTMEHNEAAVKLYGKLGFEEVDVGLIHERPAEKRTQLRRSSLFDRQ